MDQGTLTLVFSGIGAAAAVAAALQTYVKDWREKRERRHSVSSRWSLDLQQHPIKYMAFDAVIRHRIDRSDAFKLVSLDLLAPAGGALAPAEDMADLFARRTWGDRMFEFRQPPVIDGRDGGPTGAAVFEHRFMIRLPSSAQTYKWPIRIAVVATMEEISADRRRSQITVTNKATAWTASSAAERA